jgi:hypothetical protein
VVSSAARAFQELSRKRPRGTSQPAGSLVYPPERNARGQYPFWLIEVGARGFVAQRDVAGDAAVDRADGDDEGACQDSAASGKCPSLNEARKLADPARMRPVAQNEATEKTPPTRIENAIRAKSA